MSGVPDRRGAGAQLVHDFADGGVEFHGGGAVVAQRVGRLRFGVESVVQRHEPVFIQFVIVLAEILTVGVLSVHGNRRDIRMEASVDGEHLVGTAGGSSRCRGWLSPRCPGSSVSNPIISEEVKLSKPSALTWCTLRL